MTLDPILESASAAFTADSQPSNYIEVPARLRQSLVSPAMASGSDELVDPLAFLSGVTAYNQVPFGSAATAEVPSITFVLGTYGLGKSELMRQLSLRLLSERGRLRCRGPLPINLALSKPHSKFLNQPAPPSAQEFARLIFSQVLGEQEATSPNLDLLASAVVSGDAFLILDGLDELSTDPRHLQKIWLGLSEFLSAATRQAQGDRERWRVAIGLRYEVFTAWANAEGNQFQRDLSGAFSAVSPDRKSVHILQLDAFDTSQVLSYLARRSLTQWFSPVSRHPSLLELLHRPLWLRIFCDMAIGLNGAELLHRLNSEPERSWTSAQLLEEYINQAAEDDDLEQAQGTIEPNFSWNPIRLASECLEVYSIGKVALEESNLRSLVGVGGESATSEAVWRSIHKCPFLRRRENFADFTHQTLFEFLVAKGVALDMKSKQLARAEFSAFDTLVLDGDTRRFLKAIVEHEGSSWEDLTRHSYGISEEQRNEWPPDCSYDFNRLESARCALLKVTTEEPSVEDLQRARAELSFFLDLDHRMLHARYLVYNYEAATVLLEGELGVDTLNDRKRFCEVLSAQFQDVVERLPLFTPPESDAVSPKELLIERILSASRRLRFGWVGRVADKQGDRLMELIRSGEIRQRIKGELDSIRNTVFFD